MYLSNYAFISTYKTLEEAIFLENALLAINKPSSRTVTAFQHKFNNVEARGGSLKALRGASSSLYDDPEDLMVLAPQQEEDRLTRFLRYYFAVLFEVSTSFPNFCLIGSHKFADRKDRKVCWIFL